MLLCGFQGFLGDFLPVCSERHANVHLWDFFICFTTISVSYNSVLEVKYLHFSLTSLNEVEHIRVILTCAGDFKIKITHSSSLTLVQLHKFSVSRLKMG